MSFDLAMIYADITSTAAVSLMIWIIKIQLNQDHRIQRIEDDLYIANGNPTSLPLTKQVYNLQQDVGTIKMNFEKLNVTMEKINTKIQDCFPLPKKTKKGGKRNV